MKIKVVRSKLLAGIKAVQDVVKSTDAPFRNVRVETPAAGEILLTGSNGDMQIQSRVFCDTDEDCAMTLVGTSLAAFVASMDEGVVEIDEGTRTRARIACGCSEFALEKGDVSDFPIMKGPVGEKTVTFNVPIQALVDMLRKVRYAASTDKTRKIIGGVLLRAKDACLTAVATDGRRLSIVTRDVETPGDVDAVLTHETVAVVMKLSSGLEGDVTVSCDGTSIRFTAENWSVTSKLVDGVYPAFEKVIPKDADIPNRVSVDTEEFRNNVSRAALASWKENSNVKLTFENNVLTLEARNAFSRAKSRIDVKYEGPRSVIRFDTKLLLDVLGCTDADETTILFKDGRSPAVLTCAAPFKAVVMPIYTEEEA